MLQKKKLIEIDDVYYSRFLYIFTYLKTLYIYRDSSLWVDEEKNLVYFVGTRDSPLESHLYCVSCAPGAVPTNIVRLTPLGWSHTEGLYVLCVYV